MYSCCEYKKRKRLLLGELGAIAQAMIPSWHMCYDFIAYSGPNSLSSTAKDQYRKI